MAFGEVIQSNVDHDFSVTSISVSYTQTTVSGNLLICVIAPDKNSGTITIPVGFTIVTQVQEASISGALCYKISDGTETTIESSWVNTVHGSESIWEIDGPWDTNPLDVFETGTSNNIAVTSLSTGTTAETAQNDEYVFAVYLNDSSQNMSSSPTQTNGFSNRMFNNPTGGSAGQIVCDKTIASTGTQETTIGYTGSADQAITFIAAFKKDSGGGGVSITPNTINSASVSNNPAITFNSVVSLTPNAIDSLSVANNPSIQFNSVVNISPATINSASISNDPILSFSAVLNITPQTINSASAANNPSILFNSVLSLEPSTIDSLSVSNNPVIEFKSVINVLPQTIDSLSVSRNPFISFGVVQTIGNVTASFKDSGISVKYKPNAITVNFK